MNYFLPLLSVLMGYGVALFFKPTKKSNLKLLMAFSGSFLLSITVLHLLPEVYESAIHGDHNHSNVIGIFIMLGILFQIVLEFFSKGAEHGHVHSHDTFEKTPWLLFISLCIHAYLEGFPVSKHADLALGIAIHHLPIAIILTSFFLNTKLSKTTIFLFMIVFALMTPLGTLTAYHADFLQNYHGQITAIVIGILFHISSTIIFESSENHKFNLAKLSMIAIGIVVAYFLGIDAPHVH